MHSTQLDFSQSFAADELNRSTLPQRSETRNIFLRPDGSTYIDADQPEGPCDQLLHHSLKLGLDEIRFCNDPSFPGGPAVVHEVKMYADKLVIYPKRLNPRPTATDRKKQHQNLKPNRPNGFISRNSGNRIRRRLESWFKAVDMNRRDQGYGRKPKHSRINFVTLTLPTSQVHSDNEIKRKVLMPFIQVLKRKHGVQEYFWSAEPHKSGDIHFHMLVDRYIRKDLLQDRWNNATNALGYLSRYVEDTGNTDPPSTNIKTTPKGISQIKYVLKYVTKSPEVRMSCRPGPEGKETRISYWTVETDRDGTVNEYERRPIEGRSWGMSDGIRKLDVYTATMTYRIEDLLTLAQWDPNAKFVQRDCATVVYCNTYDLMLKNDLSLLSDYRGYYVSVYQELYFGGDARDKVPIIDLPEPKSDPPERHEFREHQLRVAI